MLESESPLGLVGVCGAIVDDVESLALFDREVPGRSCPGQFREFFRVEQRSNQYAVMVGVVQHGAVRRHGDERVCGGLGSECSSTDSVASDHMRMLSSLWVVTPNEPLAIAVRVAPPPTSGLMTTTSSLGAPGQDRLDAEHVAALEAAAE